MKITKQSKNKKIYKNICDEKGISIVALVVTIIILIILSTISIQALTGRGLFEQARKAELENKRGQVKENLSLNLMSAQAEKPNGSSHDVVDLAHSTIATEEKIKSLKEIGKNVEIDEKIKNEEDFKETDWYFNVTVDGDLYKVTAKGVTFVGKIKDMAPAIRITKLTNTSSTITVEVETQRNEGGKLQYYIKGDTYSDYKLLKEQDESAYTYEGLKQGVKYSIKVVAVAKNKKTVEVVGEQTTGMVTNLKEGDIKFTAVPSTSTNTDVIVTAKANIDLNGFDLLTSTDPTKGWSAALSQTFKKNGRMYVILWDGTNYGKSSASYTVTNIDKLPPNAFTPKIIEKTTNSITVDGTTTDAVATSDNASSGVKEYRFSKDGGKTYTNPQTSAIYKFEGLNQTTDYTIVVEAKDNAGNTTTGTVKSTTGTVTGLKTGDVTFTYSPSTATNKNVSVTITGNKTGYILQYKTAKTGVTSSGETGEWKNYTGAFTLTRNQSIYARVVDSTGQAGTTYATGTLTNIDKLAPNAFTPSLTVTTNSIKVTATVTDAAKTDDNASSGIKEYRFSSDGGSTYTAYQSSNTYTFNNLTQNKNYTIKVEARDNAGNTTIGTASKTTETVTTASGATYTPTTWTNGNVSVTLPTKSGYSTLYTTNGTKPTLSSTKYTSAISVSSNNTTINYVYSDGTNIGGAGTLNITNIDKTAPSTPNLSNSSGGKWTNQNVIIKAESSDSGSGIAKYQIKYSGNNNTWTDVSVPDTWSAERNETAYYRAVDKAGNVSSATSTTIKIDKSAPTFSSAEIKNVTSSGYDVYIYGVSDSKSGINRVQFPTWTEYNGEDEIQSNWTASSTAKGTQNGTTWSYHVNTSSHKSEYGLYNTHIYLYDNLGNSRCAWTGTATVPFYLFNYGLAGGWNFARNSQFSGYDWNVGNTIYAGGKGNKSMIFEQTVKGRGFTKCHVEVYVEYANKNESSAGYYLSDIVFSHSRNIFADKGTFTGGQFKTYYFTNNSNHNTFSRQVVNIDISQTKWQDFYVGFHNCDSNVTIYRVWFD